MMEEVNIYVFSYEALNQFLVMVGHAPMMVGQLKTHIELDCYTCIWYVGSVERIQIVRPTGSRFYSRCDADIDGEQCI